MRDRRAHDAHVKLVRKRDVGREPALAGTSGAVLEPRDRAADVLAPMVSGALICASPLRGRGEHRVDDVLVAGAAAKIGRQRVAQLGVADVRIAAPASRPRASGSPACRSRIAARDAPMNACCSGCSVVAVGEPFDGADRAPSACTANIRQDRTGSPSTITVQAPQTPCSQPRCVPVRPQSSRIASASVCAARPRCGARAPLTSRQLESSPSSRAPSPPRSLADAPRRYRHLVDLDAERLQRVVDRVQHRRRRADRPAFADALRLGDRGVGEVSRW